GTPSSCGTSTAGGPADTSSIHTLHRGLGVVSLPGNPKERGPHFFCDSVYELCGGRRGGRTCTLMAINAVISLRKESGGHLRAATARRYQIPTTGPAGPWASRALHGPRPACRWRWQPACY